MEIEEGNIELDRQKHNKEEISIREKISKEKIISEKTK